MIHWIQTALRRVVLVPSASWLTSRHASFMVVKLRRRGE
jgi:hypothetical protein